MKITFTTIGSFKSKEFEKTFEYFLKLSGKFNKISHLELSERSIGESVIKLFNSKPRAFITVLDEKGHLFQSSSQFSKKIEKIKDGSYTDWLIICGSAYGFGQDILQHADLLWSLSPLTMAHELASVVAAEQVFRGLSILHKHPYHH